MRAWSRVGWVALVGSAFALVDGLLQDGSWTAEAHSAARIAGVAGLFALAMWGMSEALARALRGNRARAWAIVVSWWCWIGSVHAGATRLATRYRDPELVALAIAATSVVLAWVVGGVLHPLVERSVPWLQHRPARPAVVRCGVWLGLGLAAISAWAWATPASQDSSSRLAAALSRLFGLPIDG